MIHVKQIEQMVAAGESSNAHDALDNLLALGPKNLVALKLRAQLFEESGRFLEEAKVWELIAQVDKDDHDLFRYLTRRHVEEREFFYFTEDLPNRQGRRFVGYSRKLVSYAFFGVMGCLTFLIVTRLGYAASLFSQPAFLLAMFAACVLFPWLGILTAFFTSIKHITISESGIEIATRLKTYAFDWVNIQGLFVVKDVKDHRSDLFLLLNPKDRAVRPIRLDFRFVTSPIRSRSYFLREVCKVFPSIQFIEASDLPKLAARPISF